MGLRLLQTLPPRGTACGQQSAEGETCVPTTFSAHTALQIEALSKPAHCPLGSILAKGSRDTPGAQAGGTFLGQAPPPTTTTQGGFPW